MRRPVHGMLMASTVAYNDFSIPAASFRPLHAARGLVGSGRDHVSLLVPCVAAVLSG